MPITQGVAQGISEGVVQGVNPGSGPILAANGAAWDAVLSSPTPTTIYTYQEASGTIADRVASNDLDVITGDPVYQDLAEDSPNYRVLINSTDTLSNTSTTFMDPASVDLGGFLRVLIPSTAATRYLCGKATSTVGFSLRTMDDGHLELFWNPTSGVNQLPSIDLNHRDDIEHSVGFAIDNTNSELRVYSDLGNTTLALTSGAGTNAAAFLFGVIAGVGSPDDYAFRYAALWDGYAPTLADFNEWAGL